MKKAVGMLLVAAIALSSVFPVLAQAGRPDSAMLNVIAKRQYAIELHKTKLASEKIKLDALATTLLNAKSSKTTATYVAIPFVLAGAAVALFGGVKLAKLWANVNMNTWNSWDTMFSLWFGGITLAGVTTAGTPLYIVHVKTSKTDELLELIDQARASIAASETNLANEQAELKVMQRHLGEDN